MILSGIAGSRFSYDAGISGAVTVPNGKQVIGITCLSVAGGSLTIAPGGANHPNPPVAGASIPLPANASFDLSWAGGLTQLGGGTVITFTSTDSYFVAYAQMKVG